MTKRIERAAILMLITFSLLFTQAMPLWAEVPTVKTVSSPSQIMAPDFTLKGLTGKPWKLNDYRGKVVLLDFTTTWCPYCIKDIPNLKKIHSQYTPQGLEFVAIYLQESEKRVSSFATKHSIPYNILLDPDARTSNLYGVRGVPTKIVVDRDGTIVCWMCEDSDLEKHLERLLKR